MSVPAALIPPPKPQVWSTMLWSPTPPTTTGTSNVESGLARLPVKDSDALWADVMETRHKTRAGPIRQPSQQDAVGIRIARAQGANCVPKSAVSRKTPVFSLGRASGERGGRLAGCGDCQLIRH